MKTTSLTKRMISGVTVAALALTMFPLIPGTAHAVEGVANGSIVEQSDEGIDPLAVQAINVSVPVVVTFGGTEGYDIANPSDSITQGFKIQNKGDTALMVKGIEINGSTDSTWQDMFEAVSPTEEVTNDSRFFGANYKNWFSLYPTTRPDQAVDTDADESLVAGTYTKFANDLFLVGSNGELDCTWRLNLTNTDDSNDYYKMPTYTDNSNVVTATTAGNKDVQFNAANLNSIADGSFHKLVDVKYYISEYVPKGSLTVRNGDGTINQEATNAKLEQNSAFYLIDKGTNECFSLTDVKNHSNDITKNGENSVYYGMYLNYIKDESAYECRTTWGTSWKVPNEIKGIADEPTTEEPTTEEPGTPTEGGTEDPDEGLNVKDSIRYDLDIVGLLHDDRADNTGKAGLTFQFSGLLYPDAVLDDANNRKRVALTKSGTEAGYWPVNETNTYPDGSTWFTDSASDGWQFWPKVVNNQGQNNPTWKTSLVRNEMNPPSMQYTSDYSNITNSRIWNKIPSALQTNMVSVNKATVEWNGADFAIDAELSTDKVFLASARELLGDAGIKNTGNANSLSKEGYQYEYYKVHNVQNNVSSATNEPLQRYYLNEDGTVYSGSKEFVWENHRSAASGVPGSRLLYKRDYNGSASSLSRVNVLAGYTLFYFPISFSPMFCL
ncbi:hypothetical protein [Adlercreutzia sp. ZJ304]|uniref:hypothetical protein n=1 Tax=Adlercreutzia sp. ZJ304 TaxID=2709791 RepID=UPI0013EE1BE7|nr:hypothetical protein [Adlercreutzia sp. ZJ304]